MRPPSQGNSVSRTEPVSASSATRALLGRSSDRGATSASSTPTTRGVSSGSRAAIEGKEARVRRASMSESSDPPKQASPVSASRTMTPSW